MPYIPVPDGTDGGDAPHLGDGDDYYDAKGGDDTIDPGRGDNYIIGGPGNDTLQLNWHYNAPGIISAALQIDPAGGYMGNYRIPIDGFAQVQFTSIENFIINSPDGNDNIVTGDGNDIVNMFGGDDVVFLGLGNDSADGGSGNDGYGKTFADQSAGLTINLVTNTYANVATISNFEYFSRLIGGSGNDTFVSTDSRSSDLISGGAGNDTLNAGLSGYNAGDKDIVHGDGGTDTLEINWNYSIPGMTSSLMVDSLGGYKGSYTAGGYTTVEFDGIEKFHITGTQSADNIVTGDGDDIVDGGASDDFLYLGKGTDVAEGGSGTDGYGKDYSDRSGDVAVDLNAGTVTGAGGNTATGFEYFSAITGGSGNDTFTSSQTRVNDLMDGGSGNDRLNAGLSGYIPGDKDVVHGGAGTDTLVFNWDYSIGGMISTLTADGSGGYGGNYTTAGGFTTVQFDGIENFDIHGTQSADTITTGNGNDVVDAGASDDITHLGKGVDTAEGGSGNDGYGKDFSAYSGGVSVDLGAGTIVGAGLNTATGFEYFSDILGGSGNDTFTSAQTRTNDLIDGGAGNDRLNAGLGGYNAGDMDVVHGGIGNDTLVFNWDYSIGGIVSTLTADGFGGYSGSYTTAGAFTTVAFDGIENFDIHGTQSADSLTTGNGNDVVDAGASNDVTHLGKGVDVAEGGSGTDGYGKDFSDYSGGVGVDLAAGVVTGAGGNTATGFEYFSDILGGSGNDTFTSTQTRDNDLIDGGAGNDRLNAGLSGFNAGDKDIVHGGTGNDTLAFNWDYSIGGIVTTLVSDGGGTYHGTFDGGGYTAVQFDGIENFDIHGTQSGDAITTGNGNDVVDAGASDDVTHLGKGVDTADGGSGTDGYGKDFSDYSGGVLVDLVAGTVTGAGGNSAVHFEYFTEITGGEGNDTFISASLATGVRMNDVINGGGGDDTLDPGLSSYLGGMDTVNGGAGTDTLSLDYGLSIGGLGATGTTLSVDPDGGYSGVLNGGNYTQVQFTGIEKFHIRGTQSDDAFQGGNGNDWFDGYAGTDTFILPGDVADYEFYDGGAGAVLVKDKHQAWGQGLDTLISVEKLQFADRTVDTSSLVLTVMPPAPPPPPPPPPVNHAPTGAATANLAHGAEDTAYIVSVATLLQGFSDADSDALSVTGLSATHAMISDNGNGTFTITPAANYNGAIALSYTVSDGKGGTIAAGQSIVIDAVNDIPTGAPTASLPHGTEDTAYIVSAASLLQGFTDVDGDGLSVTGLSAAHASVVNNGNGTFTVTPAANYNGPVAHSYTVSDGDGGTVAALQTLVIDPVNDAPTAVNDTGTTAQNTALTLPAGTLLANDSDIEGDGLVVTGVNGASHGSVSLSGGIVTFTPANGYSGAAGFGYDISDGHGGTAHATVNVTVVAPSTPASQYIRLSEGADTINYAAATTKLSIAALGGNDRIYGSAFDDSINGGAGNDMLSGGGGKDVLTGGTGADVVLGGAGNDSFVFNAGDLRAVADPLSDWGFDRIGDFEGAGQPSSATPPQDLIQFFGFGAGSTLTFDHYGSSQSEQYYVLHDPTKASNDGYILIAMATGTTKLTAGDYHFY